MIYETDGFSVKHKTPVVGLRIFFSRGHGPSPETSAGHGCIIPAAVSISLDNLAILTYITGLFSPAERVAATMRAKRLTIYIVLAIFTGVVGYLVLFKLTRPPMPGMTAGPGVLALPEQRPVKSMAHLYFVNRENTYLVAEKRELVHSGDPVDLAKMIIDGLIKGPLELVRTLPSDTRLRALFIDSNHTAYVDFNGTLQEKHPGGIRSEFFSVYSVVNSLILNVPEITRVNILIGGREAQTLAGHIDIRFPFKANMLLVR